MNPHWATEGSPASAEGRRLDSEEVATLRLIRLSRLLGREEQRYSDDWRAIKTDVALVELTTTSGRKGFGEVSSAAPAAGVARCLDWIGQRLRGRRLGDAFELSRPSGSSLSWDGAAAAVDSALWDVTTRLGGLPLHEGLNRADLSGQPAHPVWAVADAGCCFDWAGRTDAVLEEATDCAASSFESYCLRIGTKWEWDNVRPDRFVALAWEVHSELGDTALVVDADERLAVPDAIRIAEGLAEIGCAGLRRPFSVTALDSYRQLAASSPLPVTTGGRLTTFERLLPFLDEGLLGGIEFEIGLCGISEARKRCALAAEYALPVHAVGDLGAVGALGAAHVLAAKGLDGRVHVPYAHGTLTGGILNELVTIERGLVKLSPSPGIGAEVTSEQETAFPWVEGSSSIAVNRELI